MDLFIFENRKIDIIDSLTEFLIANSDLVSTANSDTINAVNVYNSWKDTFWKFGELPGDREVDFAMGTIFKLLR